MNVLVTGANGFIGSNLYEWLKLRMEIHPGLELVSFEKENTDRELYLQLRAADFVYHLAGVNRPESAAGFRVNVELTARICDHLLTLGRAVPIVFSSSAQALLDNPYGASKLEAEAVLGDYAAQTAARVVIYRLKSVFGKWCRPNYNSVVATFCYNIGRDLSVSMRDPFHSLDLVYIDDVVCHFIAEMYGAEPDGLYYRDVGPTYSINLADLAELLFSFRATRRNLVLPALRDDFVRKMYGTYLSYLDPMDFAYMLIRNCDSRGCLAEFIKSPSCGQVFISRTVPGGVRGNHYHHTKAEKFLVLEGRAIVKLRHLLSSETEAYMLGGEAMRVLDVPPGFAHSIENVGTGDLVTLFWASEMFDPQKPDTYSVEIQDVQG